MIKVKNETGKTSINPRFVDLISQREDGIVRTWIGEHEYIVDMSYEEAVAEVDKASR